MDCAICSRHHDSQRLPFLCPIDARNKIYPNRLQNLKLVLESERLRAEIKSDDNAGYTVVDSLAARRRLAEDRTDEILAAALRLRSDISAARDEIKARSLALARRRSDLASVREGLRDRRARQLRDVDAATQALRLRWKESAKDMACTRAFLCNEAVRLYGFRRSKKPPSGRYDYQIARVPVVDLADMHSLGHDVISTSLAHIAHVLMLVSHYLAIRLPAEITLPHRDYPQPTIFNLAGSYQHSPSSPNSRSPNGTLTPSFLHPPEADSHHVPRPRPLFVDKPLPQLSEEDPATYSFFLEGVTLLAYDIAWLCCSQGVPVGDKGSFEDLCHMSRNLYSFVFEAQRQGFCHVVKPVDTAEEDPSPDEATELQTDWIGRYSHGTNYHSLGSAHGTDFTRSFKLPSPMKLADKLKRKLLGDAPADWEVLDDEAWRAVDEGGKAETGGEAAANGVKTGAVDRDAVKGSQKSETNGWTKVKHKVGIDNL
ncbi:UV radiation resistance protein/autophagy-related protein 14 [Ophiocordyceps camponoti-floridani]|uniref:Autophagy-related protein 14 n=1 Tax=Ophiocordyceps camponoti-floridani TaxID=2030778 RepID=A0A8H4QA50_9HYPO|nr:UV radiation resistance protein/autophagy-related protein 14 [Ophiocordyceps camponoti-floridani]